MARQSLFFVLLFVVGVTLIEAYGGLEDDELDTEALEMYPLEGLKSRRGLDFCQTNANPCKNGGSCCSDAECTRSGKYTCRCKSPYGGPHCEKKCPIKACWNEYYNKAYDNGRKRALSEEACKNNVEAAGECLKSAVQSHEACHCEIKDIEEAKTFEKEMKHMITSHHCSGSQKCGDPKVKQCLSKVYKIGGAMDSNRQRSEKERCSLVDEAVSCMNSLAGSDFAGCPSNRKVFTEKVGMRQAQWKTWCMGKYCSLRGCGDIRIPQECSESSMVNSIKPVMACIKEKLEKCVPSMMSKLEKEIREVESELRNTVLEKCKLKKEVSGKCGRNKRILQARELLRSLLEDTLAE